MCRCRSSTADDGSTLQSRDGASSTEPPGHSTVPLSTVTDFFRPSGATVPSCHDRGSPPSWSEAGVGAAVEDGGRRPAGGWTTRGTSWVLGVRLGTAAGVD